MQEREKKNTHNGKVKCKNKLKEKECQRKHNKISKEMSFLVFFLTQDAIECGKKKETKKKKYKEAVNEVSELDIKGVAYGALKKILT